MATRDHKATFNLPCWADAPFPCSQAVRAGPLIFTSGHLATDYTSGIAAEAATNPHRPYDGPPAISRQTGYVFDHLGRVLELAGSSLNSLVRARTVHNEARRRRRFRGYAPQIPRHRPADQFVARGEWSRASRCSNPRGRNCFAVAGSLEKTGLRN